MRITNPTLLRGYNRDLNRVMNLKNKSEHMITTTRRFSRASDDPLSAAKALNVRKSQYYSEQHQENLNVAAKFYTEAETSLIQVSEQMAIIRETIIAAVNTTKENQDLTIYAQQLATKAQELCEIFNTDSAGRAIFGGSSDDSQPFEILMDSNGFPATVTYHGIPVNSMRDFLKFPYSDEVDIDIGLGMVVNQQSHYIDPDTVLKVSFNGPEVTGCGAERGVADVDLSSIVEDRAYSLCVYAGDVKKQIDFVGQGSMQANVDEINRLLKEAYKKEIAYGRDYPEMDAQGVISLRDKMGDAVENGVVTVVNNPYPPKHTSQLKVDNDSNYTDKYKLCLDKLPEGETIKLNVQLGNGEVKVIEFETGVDNVSDPNNPIFREDVTVKNFQEALDAAFGEGVINISANDPTKGVISSEGNIVKLSVYNDPYDPSDPEEPETVYGEAVITKSTADVAESGNIYLAKLQKDTTYAVNVTVGGTTKKVVFKAGKTVSDTKNAIAEAVGKAFEEDYPDCDVKVNNKGEFTFTDKDGNEQTVTLKEVPAGELVSGEKSVDLGVKNSYSIDLDSLENGKEYSLKFIVGNDVKNITFTAGADAAANKKAIEDALGGFATIGDDGSITSADGKPVTVSNNPNDAASGSNMFEREAAYSYNYIQLTLDAARALREGDISYANGCIDRLVEANEKLLVQIADLGCNEEFIDFNISRLTTRDLNLAERQNDLEIIDPAEQITLWKQYEAMYNACLQMSSSVVPQSIFDYI